MAGKGDSDLWKVAGAIALGGLFIYLATSRGKNNSPFLPDAIEDRINRLVAVLNEAFGQRWVNAGLDALQRYIEQTMPQLTGLLKLVFWVERNYGFVSGAAKKAAVLRAAT